MYKPEIVVDAMLNATIAEVNFLDGIIKSDFLLSVQRGAP